MAFEPSDRQADPPYTWLEDVRQLAPEIPANSILSRTIFQDAHVRVILFAFAAGEMLSEHTAAKPAQLTFLAGSATVTLGGDSFTAKVGSLALMPPHLPHSIVAHDEVIMLLHLFEGEK